ncbi:transcriptional regulator [Salmonella enterica]|uniref:Transcriptional regulator n=1 Tax=Salmonella enterica subsp. VII serovar 40:z4,z24:[z39] TaxID=1967625 RepID=A0A731XXD9_SALEE|nr:transcriptional regulator [Salmonella enterica]EDO5295130.1 transcriptional regulator [Salmonella enterica subsp. houtenae serovar 40:z4,z24:-]EDS6439274.1 transcriptional regulator [Salmonella enterica subsp. VII str. CFSAN000550]EDT6884725.1 transcriptional regulator [Salmonella enterica subsp. enterica]EDU7900930.1 transcriptional regulator [Salmonella enterica subsp. houtenae]QJY67617.1 transcriptional regulator [Salmonella enterica subsp. VII serovar 1,40:g,z51:--]QUZ24444.1 transcrip
MKNVIIYGINWTNCYALQSIFKQKYPEKRVKTCNSLTALLHSISDMPDAGLILSLNPHEHVYLFHALQARLQSRKVLVVADRLYYIDRCVLQYFGVMDYVLKDELSCIICSDRAKTRLPEAWLRFCHRSQRKTVAATYAFNTDETPEEVLFNINQYAWWNLPPGVTQAKYALLILLSSGHPAVELAKKFSLGTKTVSIYRKKVMHRLGMDSSPLSLFRGLKLDARLQRTAFAPNYSVKADNCPLPIAVGIN